MPEKYLLNGKAYSWIKKYLGPLINNILVVPYQFETWVTFIYILHIYLFYIYISCTIHALQPFVIASPRISILIRNILN